MSARLEARALTKRFGLRAIIDALSLELTEGMIVAVTGRNGSGKSTLMRLLAGVALPSAGEVRWEVEGRLLGDDDRPLHIGMSAPYLNLYGEFSPRELFTAIDRMRGGKRRSDEGLELLGRLGLRGREEDPIEEFSSGMIQRVRHTVALMHDPRFLFLDEPRTNLDRSGIDALYEVVTATSARRITLVATNEPEDLAICNSRLRLEE